MRIALSIIFFSFLKFIIPYFAYIFHDLQIYFFSSPFSFHFTFGLSRRTIKAIAATVPKVDKHGRIKWSGVEFHCTSCKRDEHISTALVAAVVVDIFPYLSDAYHIFGFITLSLLQRRNNEINIKVIRQEKR